jgi:hypothetical protein
MILLILELKVEVPLTGYFGFLEHEGTIDLAPLLLKLGNLGFFVCDFFFSGFELI